MRDWARQLAGTVLVVVFAVAVGGFIMVLRTQQSGPGASMAAANVRAVSPADGATNVPVCGDLRAEYVSRPSQDPSIKVEPPAGVTLDPGHWDGSAFVVHYCGLRENSLYHVELDQDSWTGKGEHKQIRVRWSFRTGPGETQTPSARPTSSTSASPVPSPSDPRSPGIWYRASSLLGLDWNGQRVRSLNLGDRVQSPDGRLLWNPGTPSTEIDDADGHPVGSIAGLSPAMWADDSRQFCAITYRPYTLGLETLDGKFHPVGAISMPPGTMQTPQLAACSVLTGRAIVVGESNGYVWSLSMISLTDGTVIYKQSYPNPLARLIASHDGHYVAEQLASNANASPTTLIRELPSGNVVAQLTGIMVQGFSWDGSLVAGATGTPAALTGAEVLRWQTNQVVWNRCGCPSLFGTRVLAQPGGTRLAIAATDQQMHGTLTIVDATGLISVPVANQSILPAF
jgi:hypothetical protein